MHDEGQEEGAHEASHRWRTGALKALACVNCYPSSLSSRHVRRGALALLAACKTLGILGTALRLAGIALLSRVHRTSTAACAT